VRSVLPVANRQILDGRIWPILVVEDMYNGTRYLPYFSITFLISVFMIPLAVFSNSHSCVTNAQNSPLNARNRR